MNKNLFSLTVFLLLLFCTAVSFAQKTGSVRGFLYDKENGEPVLYTPVFIKGTQFGSITDVNGFYSITNVPPGSYFLTIGAIGYDSSLVEIIVYEDKVTDKQIYIKKGSVNLKTVEVSAEKEA